MIEGLIMKRGLISLVVAAFGTASLWAHDGHTQRVMGTITKIEQGHLEVQSQDGKKLSVMLDGKTNILRGKVKARVIDLVEGERVVIDAHPEKDHLMAKTVRLGATTAAKTAAKSPAKP